MTDQQILDDADALVTSYCARRAFDATARAIVDRMLARITGVLTS